MSWEKGILGMRKDPKRQMLFMFKVPEGEEWPSSDSEDSDYSLDGKISPGNSDSNDSDVNINSFHKNQKLSPCQIKNSKDPQMPTKKLRHHMADHKHLNNFGQDHLACSSSMLYSSEKDNIPSLPSELWLMIFHYFVEKHGPLPFLCRAARVCRHWSKLTAHPSLWHKIDLSYGWVKSKDETLKWLSQNRLSQCRELHLSGWKNVTNDALKVLCENCQQLEIVSLSNCSKLTSSSIYALVNSQKKLRELDLAFLSSDAVSTQSLKLVAKKVGTSLTSLVLSGNKFKGFNLVLNSVMDNCPNLDTLDLSNCQFSTDFLMLNVEKLQASCPFLRILLLASCKIRGTQASQQAQAEARGFIRLQQLSCAMPNTDSPTIGSGVSDDLLARLLHKADKLQLLDLRGCTNFHPDTLLAVSAQNVEQLYLSQSNVSRYSHTLRPLFMMWRHSLKIVDLAWTVPAQEHMSAAIKTLTDLPTCGVTHLNLAGTPVTQQFVRLALNGLHELMSLDLTSCRSLPRGIKCLHEGTAALRRLMKILQKLDNTSGSDTEEY